MLDLGGINCNSFDADGQCILDNVSEWARRELDCMCRQIHRHELGLLIFVGCLHEGRSVQDADAMTVLALTKFSGYLSRRYVNQEVRAAGSVSRTRRRQREPPPVSTYRLNHATEPLRTAFLFIPVVKLMPNTVPHGRR